jgi:hypothetical protein
MAAADDIPGESSAHNAPEDVIEVRVRGSWLRSIGRRRAAQKRREKRTAATPAKPIPDAFLHRMMDVSRPRSK